MQNKNTMANSSSIFDNFKKGDVIEITYDSAVRKNDSKKLKVKGKSTVMKGKPGEAEKITFENVSNPSGVKYYAFRKTSDGSVRYAVGDMSIWNVQFPEKFDGGGSFKTYIVEYEINGKRSISEYLLLPSDRVEKLLPATAKIISIKEKSNSKGSKFDGGGYSEIGKDNTRMLRNQIKEVAHHSNEIKGVVNKKTKVEPWVVAKMERASSDLSDVTHYLDGNKYAGGGNIEIGTNVFAYFYEDYMGAQLVESPAMGDPVDGRITDIIQENGRKKYVIKFENGETKKLSESMFEDYITVPKYDKGGDISKIKFTSGELQRLSKDYYNLYLYNNGERVYSATLPTFEAAKVADKYNNIKMKYAGGGNVGDIKTLFKNGRMNWTQKELNNVAKIAKELGATEFYHFSSGGGFEHIALLLPDNTIVQFNNEGEGISASKKKYNDLENDFYNDEDFYNMGYYPNVSLKPDFSNAAQIVKAIKDKDYVWAYDSSDEPKYAGGGDTEEGIDLFEDYENIPDKVQKVLNKYAEGFENEDYAELGKAQKELEKIGYTFDFYLDGTAYDLRPIGTKGKTETMEDSDDNSFFADGGGPIGNKIKIGDEVYARWNEDMKWTLGTFKGETENGFEVYDFTIEKPDHIEYYFEISKNPYPYFSEKDEVVYQSKNWKGRNYKNYHFNKVDEDGWYKDGGGTDLQFKDKKYDITYTVRVAPYRADRWEVVSSSPNWEEDSIDTFVSKEDAVNHAKLLAGIKKESDPESRFMRNQFGDGGDTDSKLTEINGSKYFIYNFINKGNKWTVMVVWGKFNSVFVTKKTNNPFGGVLGKEFDSIGEAVDNYKDMNIKSNILFAGSAAKEYGYEPKYAGGGGIDDDMDDISSARSSAMDTIDFEYYAKQYAGSSWDKLTNKEKAELMEEIRDNWFNDSEYGDGGRIDTLIEEIKMFDQYNYPRPKTKGDRVRVIFKHYESKGYTTSEINKALGKMNYGNGVTMYVKGGNVKIGDIVYPETLSGKWKVVEILDKKDSTGKVFMGGVYYDTIIENEDGERMKYPSNRYEQGGTMYAPGGSTDDNSDKIDKLQKVVDSNLVPDSVKDKARKEIEKLKAAKDETSESEMQYESDDFSFLNDLSEKELDERLDSTRKQQEINGKKYLNAKKSGLNTLRIEKNMVYLSDLEQAIIDLKLKKFDKEVETDVSGELEQREWNKKAAEKVKKAKVHDMIGLVAEALQDANYHTEAFKFAKLLDSSIKTKEDWYRAEKFQGDDKTTKVAIEIAKGSGWDAKILVPTLDFVLKVNGAHNVATALNKAMEEENQYPNRIENLTDKQEFYVKEIASRTATDQRAVTEFAKNNGLTESELLNIVQGLGMKKISPMDFVSALMGNVEFEKQIVDFAKSNEAFKGKPSGPLKSETSETQEAIDLLMELAQDQKGKAKKETLEAIEFLKELL